MKSIEFLINKVKWIHFRNNQWSKDGVESVWLHWWFGTWINISVNEILKKEFWVFEIAGVVVVGLSVDFFKSLSQIFLPPDELLEIFDYIEKIPSCWNKYSFCLTSSCDLSQQYSSNKLTLRTCCLYSPYADPKRAAMTNGK